MIVRGTYRGQTGKYRRHQCLVVVLATLLLLLRQLPRERVLGKGKRRTDRGRSRSRGRSRHGGGHRVLSTDTLCGCSSSSSSSSSFYLPRRRSGSGALALCHPPNIVSLWWQYLSLWQGSKGKRAHCRHTKIPRAHRLPHKGGRGWWRQTQEGVPCFSFPCPAFFPSFIVP